MYSIRAAIEMMTGEMPFQEYTNNMALIWNIGRLSNDKPSAPKPPKPPDSVSREGRNFIAQVYYLYLHKKRERKRGREREREGKSEGGISCVCV